ncbi:MAG: hypothetical protein RI922_2205 [Bacteroidota bacterium]|jgi:hypothetical protein
MENTLTHFQTENLEIKLTEEKLFITTPTSTETFALRSIDGIGVIDMVDGLNAQLRLYKQVRFNNIIFMFCGIVLFLFGFFSAIMFGIGAAIIALIFFNMKRQVKPTLKSAVRIMMTGGNRDFIFDKANTNSAAVAEFVANVEDTLTAFHKK